MSVWDGYQGAVTPPPGTPSIEIRRTPQGGHTVLVSSRAAHQCQGYQQARLWVQNTYRLTSTMFLPIHADYQRVMDEQCALAEEVLAEIVAEEQAAAPNKYRKPSR